MSSINKVQLSIVSNIPVIFQIFVVNTDCSMIFLLCIFQGPNFSSKGPSLQEPFSTNDPDCNLLKYGKTRLSAIFLGFYSSFSLTLKNFKGGKLYFFSYLSPRYALKNSNS